jgi:chorismate mutase/prephenate dehydratase
VDEGIVRLIARRLEMVGLVIKEKAGRPQPIRDPARERLVLARWRGGPVAGGVGARWRARSSPRSSPLAGARGGHACRTRAAGREVAIAYQGSPSTYNHLAAEKYAGERGLRRPVPPLRSHKEVIDQLESGAVDLAFLPIENTAAGSINQVYDLLREHDFHIVGEETFKVEHCLAATAEVPLEALHQILSTRWPSISAPPSSTGCPRPTPSPVVDTAEALRLVAEAKDDTQAAIGSARGGGRARPAPSCAEHRRPRGDPHALRGPGPGAPRSTTRASPARPASSSPPATSRGPCCAACSCCRTTASA